MSVDITYVSPGDIGNWQMIETQVSPSYEIPDNGFRIMEKKEPFQDRLEKNPALSEFFLLPTAVRELITPTLRFVASGNITTPDTTESVSDAIFTELKRLADEWRNLFIDPQNNTLRSNWNELVLNSTNPLRTLISWNTHHLQMKYVEKVHRDFCMLVANRDNFEITFSPESFE